MYLLDRYRRYREEREPEIQEAYENGEISKAEAQEMLLEIMDWDDFQAEYEERRRDDGY